MSDPLILAIPSKGRLKEQAEAWLADCGLSLSADGGPRGYSGALDGFERVQIRLASATDIASALALGEIHLGVTGEDLLGESEPTEKARLIALRALGFGRANLVVAAPRSWIDVATMADIDDLAHLAMARTGRRLRVATKYLRQTRAFFDLHAIADYRAVESSGATEGAPAAGLAEIVVDITTTGATLAANGLKVLDDGLILKSQAQLAASLCAEWTAQSLVTARRLLSIVEARARGRRIASLVWPAKQDGLARAAVSPFVVPGDPLRTNGVLAANASLFAAARALTDAGVGPVSVTHPTYVFEATSEAADRLEAAIRASDAKA
ncbi:MAG TPA: ATP phosphoribosyltransferase [Caulobacteraceae bacterium]